MEYEKCNSRCKTECDFNGISVYDAPYLTFTIPEDTNGAGGYSKCLRFVEKENVENFTCNSENFSSKVEECKRDFIFKDKTNTIANEVNIYETQKSNRLVYRQSSLCLISNNYQQYQWKRGRKSSRVYFPKLYLFWAISQAE